MTTIPTPATASPSTIFYGWWMVAACLVIAVVSWSLGLFGASVFLHAVTQAHGWSIGVVSSAITLFYLTGAFTAMTVGTWTARHGPRPVVVMGALTIAAGVAGVGQVSAPWHVHAAFFVMGIGWSCLSMTAITTMLAPWFERHQGRAVSTALMGASLGGLVGTPALIFGIGWLGLAGATLLAAAIALAVLLPIALLVLRHRPQDMGLLPDGEPPSFATATAPARLWTRGEALRTAAVQSVIVTFGIGLLIQIGFLTHHVALVAPSLGDAGASATVAATAITAFLGRVALARFADRIDVRLTAGAVLILAAASLVALALFPVPAVLIAASAVYGLTVGNVTTLSPIIVRREFGAASFGAVYGLAAMAIQLVSAFGPSVFGFLRDAFGGYGPVLLIAAAFDVVAAVVVVVGGRRGRPD
jgi:MFS family permease